METAEGEFSSPLNPHQPKEKRRKDAALCFRRVRLRHEAFREDSIFCLSVSLQLGHFAQTLAANITFLIFANLVHGTAKYAFGTITLQNNMIALNQNFNRVPLIHLIPFTKGFRQNNSAELIHFAHYTSRLHLTHTFPIQLI
ncbi:hypothetical protein VK70_05065 [Paenibacillus durus ATCC 35681]|uniref:Uncharacterized protein n=1 Tax=Paenibacillus durus ATCC 35681 TaxID=1333534 RepID=A0A0F7F7E1_PAEDU|nr:hypothetical protein VK70_05065 [Paenibacillus durus ATCC 35681]